MTVEEAIRTIIKLNGSEILDSPSQFQSMIMDYSRECKKDVQLFCLSCQKGLLTYGQRMILQENEEVLIEIATKAKEMLQRDAFMAEDYAAECVNMLLVGLGYSIVTNWKSAQTQTVFPDKNMSSPKRQTYKPNSDVRLSESERIDSDNKVIKNLKDQVRNGDVNAVLSLGNRYYRGIGVKKDLIIAESYFRLVLSMGNDEAINEAKILLNRIMIERQIDFFM